MSQSNSIITELNPEDAATVNGGKVDLGVDDLSFAKSRNCRHVAVYANLPGRRNLLFFKGVDFNLDKVLDICRYYTRRMKAFCVTRDEVNTVLRDNGYSVCVRH